MKRLHLLFSVLLFIAVLMGSCTKDNESIAPVFALQNADSISADEYAIYSVLLSESSFPKTQYEVQQSTSTAVDTNYKSLLCTKAKELLPVIDTTLFDNYTKANARSYNLGNFFNASGKDIKLVASAELGYIFSSQDLNQNWNLFYSRYPDSGGVVEFTRVGFNKDHTQAITQIICTSATLDASGQILILTKVNNRWKITSTISNWQSK
jgi:hypothetical protein